MIILLRNKSKKYLQIVSNFLFSFFRGVLALYRSIGVNKSLKGNTIAKKAILILNLQSSFHLLIADDHIPPGGYPPPCYRIQLVLNIKSVITFSYFSVAINLYIHTNQYLVEKPVSLNVS